MKSRQFPSPRWRQDQDRFNRNRRRRKLLKRFSFFVLIPGIVLAVLALHWLSGSSSVKVPARESSDLFADNGRLHIWPEGLSRKELAGDLVQSLRHASKFSARVAYKKNGADFIVDTTIDEGMQKYISRLLGWSRTRQAAVVVMNPYDGRILSMASRDKQGSGHDLFVRADFPAASLFKIVSASAALEAAGFSPDVDTIQIFLNA